jgi:superfamily II DNA or RNA helicase
MEGQRLAYGHLTNPTFGTESSKIEPLPHQRTAVYERMLGQPRLRFLLADDAGAGKTIMTGLYVREMLSRGLLRRVLVVPPAGLVGNWRREMHELFSLPFRAIEGRDAEGANPFTGPESDLLIVSIDTLDRERMFSRLQEPQVEPYDLVVFDEAHKLSARRRSAFSLRRTDRYRLGEALAGVRVEEPRWQLDWHARHLLLLTATPHMGKDFPYYCLWRLLDPEVFPTYSAFKRLPREDRRHTFIRRTKEEMVTFEGEPIYPERISNTLTYDLSHGPVSEQRLYDEATAYLQTTYNQARMLNRSAAKLAMGVFQRRLASSTYALLCSLENRVEKVEGLIEAIQSGEITVDELERRQRQLDATASDLLDETTADEEGSVAGREQHEVAEDQVLSGTVAVNLAQLEAERREVIRLRDLAETLYEDPQHEDAKFSKLLEVLEDPAYADEKVIIFTEHRDTLSFLVRRFEQLGYFGEVAQIHGGMPYQEREDQVAFFRKPVAQGGARYLAATDAAGEGINLQFCWLMVNYDVPWNPARLEQRMGRIHRYGQEHDPVIIINLVAKGTREGKVLKTLLDKLDAIREALGRDKVFDVVGRLFAGMSIKDYMEQVLVEGDAGPAVQDVRQRVTEESLHAAEAEERQVYGEGDDPRDDLDRLQERQAIERYRRLLPGNVRRFMEGAAPLLEIELEGDLDRTFAMVPRKDGALDPLWPVLETYSDRQRQRLTVHPDLADEDGQAVFVRPGERVFDRFARLFYERFAGRALRGSTFVDPWAEAPYLFHLARIDVVRRADPETGGLEGDALLTSQLVGLRQDGTGQVEEAPIEHLLRLRDGPGVYGDCLDLVAKAAELRDEARSYALAEIARPLAEEQRDQTEEVLANRIDAVQRGYDFQAARLSKMRRRYRDQMRKEVVGAETNYERVKRRQRALVAEREARLEALRREPTLIEPGEVTFLAHALVMPSSDPEDQTSYQQETERVAMREAIAYEEVLGARVVDVHTPPLAREAGLEENPGFDMLSYRSDGETRAIEVKGRGPTSAAVELEENEWLKACSLRERYWLYVVYGCAEPKHEFIRVRDPVGNLIGKPRGGVIYNKQEIAEAAEV